VKLQVPSELKVPKVLKELKDHNRRFRDMSVLSVLKEHRVRLELKEQFKDIQVLKELRELKVQQELKVPLQDMEVL
jgi:hypothetical protein